MTNDELHMSSKPPPPTDATVSRSHVTPNTSGCFPVARDACMESSSPAVSGESGSLPFEIRVRSYEDENSAVYEVCTGHTIYEFDQALRCTGVRDARTGFPKATAHACVGAQLIGGRLTRAETVDISSPLPAVGHNAILSDDEHAMTVTSPVTRVVMYLCRSTCRARSIRPAVG